MARSNNEKRDLIRRLIEGIDIAMFTTRGEDGFPVSRPLSTQQAGFDGRLLWFFVRRGSPKMAEIARDPRVNVAYASKDKNVYASVAGSAVHVDDPAKVDELWNDALKIYFDGGRDDPELALVQVTVHTVQYWEGPSTGLGKLVAFVVAAVTSDDSPLGENHLLRMQPTPRRKPATKSTAKKPAPRAAKKPAKKAAPRKAAKRTPKAKRASR